MKRLTVVAAGLALGLASSAIAADASAYSSRAALLGQPTEKHVPVTLAMIAHDVSTRWALLTHRTGVGAEPAPIMTARYDTKAAVRGERVVEFEMAPLK